MAVDDRLRRYFRAVFNWRTTGDGVWLKLLHIHASDPPGPGPRAAQRALASIDYEETRVDSS